MPQNKLSEAIGKLKAATRDALPPLTSVLDDLSIVVDGVRGIPEEREDWRKLSEELTVTITDFTTTLEPMHKATLSPSMERTMSELQGLKEVVDARDSLPRSRYFDANDSLQNLKELYRETNRLLRRLERGLMLSQYKTLSEHTLDARLRDLRHAEQARFDSAAAAATHRHACTPGTRVQVLADLMEWSKNHSGPRIYWLSGMAGTGRTTIAYSFCTELKVANQLGASFFCSRQLPKCKDVSYIICTIAYQMARYSHIFQSKLCEVLGENPDAGMSEIKAQYEVLIRQPLGEVQGAMPSGLVVVIEALDEAVDSDGIESILDLFLPTATELPFKLLLTSRPHPILREKIDTNNDHSVLYLHDIDELVVKSDIAAYLSDELKKYELPEVEINRLAATSGQLFIHAATIVRYVRRPKGPRRERDRLKTVLDQESRPGTTPYKDLDVLYSVVLKDAMDEEKLEKREIDCIQLILHSVVCAKEPVSAMTLAELLYPVSLDEVDSALEPLYSVLYRLNDSGEVATLHGSFVDFLLSKDRSGPFHCDQLKYDTILARGCFEVMRRLLRFNICDLESSFILDNDKEAHDIAKQVESAIAPHLFYACRYWVGHIDEPSVLGELIEHAEMLLKTQLLHWMEVMNLKGCIGMTLGMLSQIRRWVKRTPGGSDLYLLTGEGLRFAEVFTGNAISESTPHLYVSARSLMKLNGMMTQHYGKQVHAVLDTSKAVTEWNQTRLLATWSCANGVGTVVCSPDSNRVACGLESGEIVVLDMLNGQPVMEVPMQHHDRITALAFSHDASRIVCKSGDNTICVLDASTGDILVEPFGGHTDSITSLAFSNSSDRIVSGSHDRTVRVWDAQTGTLVAPLEGHSDKVRCVAFSPDGSRIVSCSYDRTFRVWDVNTGRTSAGPVQGSLPESVAFSPNSRIVSGHTNCSLCVWDSDSGELLLDPLEGHTRPITSVAFSHDGSRIASGALDWTVRIWDAHTGKILVNLDGGHTDSVTSVVFSHNDRRIISASSDGTVCVWDALAMPVPADDLKDPKELVTSIAVSHDDSRIVAGYGNHVVRVWDANTGLAVGQPFRGHTRHIKSVAFLQDSRYVVSSSGNQAIRVWDPSDGRELVDPLKGHTDEVCSVAVSHDSKRLVSGSLDGTVRVWNADTGEPHGEPLEGHTSPVASVVFSHDSSRIASGSSDQTVRIWDIDARRLLLAPLVGHTDKVRSVTFSHDSSWIVSGSSDRTMRVWDAHSGTFLRLLEGHKSVVTSVAFSPDSGRIASGSDDCTIRIWDARTGDIHAVLEGHTSSVTSVAFMHNGSQVVSGSEDTAIRVWTIPVSAPSEDCLTWTVESSGWVLGPDRERLAWIPSHARTFLLSPHNTLLIHPSGYLRLNLERSMIGTGWASGIEDTPQEGHEVASNL